MTTPHTLEKIEWRRQFVFLILAGFFLGTLTMLNILGVTKIIDLSFHLGDFKIPFAVTVGVLPYPITFLCTDFISELFGKRKANLVVWVGLALNVWLLFILWLGGVLPPTLNEELNTYSGADKVFYQIRSLTFATTFASMIAYLVAQFCDVHIFHYLKRKTKGKKLWLRNNASTLASQLIDSMAVMLIAHYFSNAFGYEGKPEIMNKLLILIASSYVFKVVAALLDTIPFYIGTSYLSKYLELPD
ncbi:MAG: queuosine precursor transporter [Cyclobacteriaceae bacterium]